MSVWLRLETGVPLAVAPASSELLEAHNCLDPIRGGAGRPQEYSLPLQRGSLRAPGKQIQEETGVMKKSGVGVGSHQEPLLFPLLWASEKGSHVTQAGLKLYGIQGCPSSPDPRGSAS